MAPHEHEAFGKESQDLIDGLRRLAQEIEVPPDLIADVLRRGAERLPSESPSRPWWHTRITKVWRRPVVWAPVMAIACFVAGLVVSPVSYRAFTPPIDYNVARSTIETSAQTSPKERPAPDDALRQEVVADRPDEREAQRTQREAPTAPPAAAPPTTHEVRGARQAPVRQLKVPPHSQSYAVPETRRGDEEAAAPTVQITVTLPVTLYERLMHKAQQEEGEATKLVRRAVERSLQE